MMLSRPKPEVNYRLALGHNTFTQEALARIGRSGEGFLRRACNLCLGALFEVVRDQVRAVELKQVNRVLIQPQWRNDCDQPLPSHQPLVLPVANTCARS